MLFSGAIHEHGLFKGVVNVWRKATLRSWLADNWIWSGIGFFMIVIEVVLLWVATVYWGKGMLSIGDFVLIQAYLMTTFDRLVSINRELRRFYDALADSSEMVYILEQKHDVRDVPDARPLRVTKGEIEFKDVNFSFNADKPLLAGFNLRVNPKEKVGLVGPSDAEVIEASKKAHCHEFILGLPEQYGSFVGERGIKLSGGERQRVAIARE